MRRRVVWRMVVQPWLPTRDSNRKNCHTR